MTPRVFVVRTRQREGPVDQPCGDFDLDPLVVERKAGLFDVHEDLEAGQREGAGSVEHVNAFWIPASACQIRAGGIRRGVLPAKQPIAGRHWLTVHSVFDA